MKLKSLILAGAVATALGGAVQGVAEARQDAMLGEIRMFGMNFCPRGWANADGQILPISSNQALFSLFGTMYGGDGRTTFALPDLRGRVPMHLGQGPALSPRRLGERGGSETTNPQATASMDIHSHDSMGEDWAVQAGRVGGANVSTMQPYAVIRFCVATQGIYPSRN